MLRKTLSALLIGAIVSASCVHKENIVTNDKSDVEDVALCTYI